MRGMRVLPLLAMVAAGLAVASSPSSASAANVRAACPGTLVGSTFTLTADCTTTVPLLVPEGVTLDGNGHTIRAHDAAIDDPFTGAVVMNGGHTMHLTNLTVLGTGFANVCHAGGLIGVLFEDADGSASNVTVQDITTHGPCLGGMGMGLRVRALEGTARTVDITNSIIRGSGRTGMIFSGEATVNVSGTTIGPPDTLLPASTLGQNGVQYGTGGSGGIFTSNTVIGRAFGGPGNDNTGMLIFSASNLTISDNTITGDPEVGIFVQTSPNVRIENNLIESAVPVLRGLVGTGVLSDAASAASMTLVCNTFSGWATNLDGVTQPPCITTATPLPNGRVGSVYGASLEAISTSPPSTFAVTGGALPDGLTLAPDGTIAGTPTTPGTFTFTVTVTDADGATGTREFTITVAAALPPATVGSQFVSLDPARIVDTRIGLGGTGLTSPGSTTTFTATGVGGVPAGATAVAINVTASDPTAPGFVQVFPADKGAPGESSSLNIEQAGQIVSSFVIVGLDATGRFSIFTQSSTQLVVDVFGYFVAVPESTAGRLVTVDPVRVLDTRIGLGIGTVGHVPPDGSVVLPVTSVVPADAAAVVMTVTADQGLAPGFVQVVPTGGTTAFRASSNINVDRAGETVANTVIVPLGTNGTVTLFSQSGAQLVADVVGYFTGSSAPSATTGLFIPIEPQRVRDTRATGAPVAAGSTFDVPLAIGRLVAIPPSAVAGTITATDTTAPGFVQVFPTGSSTAVGSTSSVNINGAGRVVAGATVLATSTGSLTVHSQPATHLVYDVTGFFL